MRRQLYSIIWTSGKNANDVVDAYKDFKKLRDENPDKKIVSTFSRGKINGQMEINVFIEPE